MQEIVALALLRPLQVGVYSKKGVLLLRGLPPVHWAEQQQLEGRPHQTHAMKCRIYLRAESRPHLSEAG